MLNILLELVLSQGSVESSGVVLAVRNSLCGSSLPVFLLEVEVTPV